MPSGSILLLCSAGPIRWGPHDASDVLLLFVSAAQRILDFPPILGMVFLAAKGRMQ